MQVQNSHSLQPSAPLDAGVETAALRALLCEQPAEKCLQVEALSQAWHRGELASRPPAEYVRLPVPGRPQKPALVAADAVPRRSPHTREGHAALLHAVAHIEFNAINLALDCVYRFSACGREFIDDWMRVALEESQHYRLLAARLAELGHAYGDFDAHNGLWEMAVKTDHDLLARMALVPRLLEARGLDATPPIQAKLQSIKDSASLAILDIILRDEIGHVAIGDRWFRAACNARGLEPEAAFRMLLSEYAAPTPRPPFNRDARRKAGFSDSELDVFEQGWRR